MKTVAYQSLTKLACSCGGEVILCVADDLLADGSNFLEATIVFIDRTYCANGCDVYTYSLQYDEGLLLDTNYAITDCDITGIFCAGCMVDYIKWKTGGDYTIVWPTEAPEPGDVLQVTSVVGSVITLEWTNITPT